MREKSQALVTFFLLPLSGELWRNVFGDHNQQPQVKMSQLFEDRKREREEHGSLMIPLGCQINPVTSYYEISC